MLGVDTDAVAPTIQRPPTTRLPPTTQ